MQVIEELTVQAAEGDGFDGDWVTRGCADAEVDNGEGALSDFPFESVSIKVMRNR